MRRLIVACVVYSALFSASSYAQENDRGVLPDGRAFRKDAAGNEIIDYIAELEVTNEALQRKLRSLESELRKGDAQPAKDEIRSTMCPPQKECPSPRESSGECASEVSSAISQVNTRCERRENALQDEISSLQRTVKNVKSELEERERSIRASYSHEQSSVSLGQVGEEARQITILKGKVSSLEGELKSRHEEIDDLLKKITTSGDQNEESERKLELVQSQLAHERIEQSKQKEEVLSVRAQLSDAHDRISALKQSTENEQRSLKEQVAQLEADLSLSNVRLQDALSKVETQNHETRVVSAVSRLQVKEVDESRSEENEPSLSTVSPVKAKAVESLKNNLSYRVKSLKHLLSERDKLLARVQSRPRGVSLPHTRLLSSRGLGVKEIEGRLRAVTSATEVSALSRDVSELESKAQEDIDLIERMSKGKSKKK